MRTKQLTGLLTFLSCVGVIATSVISAVQYEKALEVVDDLELEADLPLKDKVLTIAKHTWKIALPAVLSGTTTIGLICATNGAHMKAEAMLGGLAATAVANLKKYDAATLKHMGKEKFEEFKRAIGTEELKECKAVPKGKLEDGKKWYYLAFPDHKMYVQSTPLQIANAENELNRRLNKAGGMQGVSVDEVIAMIDDSYEAVPGEEDYGWFLDDTFDYNSSYGEYGFHVALLTGEEIEKGDEMATVIKPSIDPAMMSDDYYEYWQSWKQVLEEPEDFKIA